MTSNDLALAALFNLDSHGVRVYRENLVRKAVNEEAARQKITSAGVKEGAFAIVKRSMV